MSTARKELAEKIARDLMSICGSDLVVERLALMKKQSDGSEKEFGGRCFASVVEVIQDNLNEWWESLFRAE